MAKAYLKIGGKKLSLDRALTLIGREKGCHVLIDDARVSGRHAFVVRDGSIYTLYDYKSSNGIKVNGQLIDGQLTLQDGQTLEIGEIRLSFLQPDTQVHRRAEARESEPTIPAGGREGDTLTPPPAGPSGWSLREKVIHPGSTSNEEILRQSFEKDIHTLIKERSTGEDVVSKLLILYKVSSIVNSIIDTDVLLEQIVDLALEVMSADRGFIMLENEKGELQTRVSRVKDRDKEKEQDPERERDILPISRSIALHCFRSGEAILTNDALVDRRFQQSGSIQMYNIRSAMCAPLSYQETRKGVLYTDNRMSSNSFTPSDFVLLKAFAQQVAIAIENSILLANLKASLDKIQAQQEMLIQSEKMAAMGHLAAGLAHEIRNPLTAISGYLQMYFAKFKEESPFYRQMRVIEKAVVHMQHVLEGLLGFARKGPRQFLEGSINQAIEDTLLLAQPFLVKYSNVAIRKALDAQLPSIWMDQRQLQQVFLNLIMNGAQAMPQGGTLSIESKPVRDGAACSDGAPSHILVAFQDSGEGIPVEKQAQIFQPFSTGKVGGIGLGLTISKSIVEEHKGTISFESSEGKGTTFFVTLPVHQN